MRKANRMRHTKGCGSKKAARHLRSEHQTHRKGQRRAKNQTEMGER